MCRRAFFIEADQKSGELKSENESFWLIWLNVEECPNLEVISGQVSDRKMRSSPNLEAVQIMFCLASVSYRVGTRERIDCRLRQFKFGIKISSVHLVFFCVNVFCFYWFSFRFIVKGPLEQI